MYWTYLFFFNLKTLWYSFDMLCFTVMHELLQLVDERVWFHFSKWSDIIFAWWMLKQPDKSQRSIGYWRRDLGHIQISYDQAVGSFDFTTHVLRDAEDWTNWFFSMNLFNRFANRTKRFIHESEWSDCSCSRVDSSLIQMNRLERVSSELNS